MSRIGEAFGEYRAKVLPASAPEIQVTECRRAFFAGAKALLSITSEESSPGDAVTDQDMNLIIEINDELNAFNEMVKRGMA